MIIPEIRRRFAQAGAAFLMTLAAAALVWQSGNQAGQEEADSVSPAALNTHPSPPNAFTDPTTAGITESEFVRQIAEITARTKTSQTKAEMHKDAQTLYEIAHAAHFQSKGRGTLSLAAYEEALRLFRALGDQSAEAEVLTDLSDTQSLLGQSKDAEKSLRAALVLRDAGVGVSSQRADLLYRLGDFLQGRGKQREAKLVLDRALRLQQRLGNEPGMADCLTAMGQAAYEEDALALARQLLGEAAQLFAKNDKTESRAAVLGQLGEVALKEGDTDEAKRFYKEGLQVWEARQQGFWTGRFRVRLASVHLKENNLTEAKRLAEDARRLLAASNGPVVQTRALLLLGEIARREGRKQDAMRLLSEAEALYRTAGNMSGIAVCQKAIRSL